jgi:hypothetical protein
MDIFQYIKIIPSCKQPLSCQFRRRKSAIWIPNTLHKVKSQLYILIVLSWHAMGDFIWIPSMLITSCFCIQQFASKHKPQTFSRVCLRVKRDVYRWKRNVSLLMWRVIVQSLIQLFFMFWCAFVYVSVFPSSRYCKSDQTCLYSYFLWLERIIMGLEILKRARRHIKTWQLRQK